MKIQPRSVTVPQPPQAEEALPAKRGPGRPHGSIGKRTLIARAAMAALGELPHEFLLKVSQGQPIYWPKHIARGLIQMSPVFPTFEQRVDAAKAAAPYFAPRMSTVEVIKDLSDDDLDQIIASSAAEAEISVSFGGEGETGTVTAKLRTTTAIANGAGSAQQPVNGREQSFPRSAEASPIQDILGRPGQREKLVGSGSTGP